jgi:hypothetical protein
MEKFLAVKKFCRLLQPTVLNKGSPNEPINRVQTHSVPFTFQPFQNLTPPDNALTTLFNDLL